ncbi:hypothetical protein BaRGS_00035457 [Batillaria attramentaria]|uniref:Uncharacterized protein n=1 Tax=Batillaria attramentaria TaxID=370345 RepID=A0ABD0JEQ4_9CAEN
MHLIALGRTAERSQDRSHIQGVFYSLQQLQEEFHGQIQDRSEVQLSTQAHHPSRQVDSNARQSTCMLQGLHSCRQDSIFWGQIYSQLLSPASEILHPTAKSKHFTSFMLSSAMAAL